MEELKRIFHSKYYKNAHNRKADYFNRFIEEIETTEGIKYSLFSELNKILLLIIKDFENHFIIYYESIMKLLLVCKKGFTKEKAFDNQIYNNDVVEFLNIICLFLGFFNKLVNQNIQELNQRESKYELLLNYILINHYT